MIFIPPFVIKSWFLFKNRRNAYLCTMEDVQWFESWFDTAYYHILYKNRDDQEAKRFVENLITFLQLPQNSSVLDLACGKGRHSITLAAHGFNVLGVDLSEQSITAAKQFEKENLHFATHDMREVIANKKFDAVFNLFTSFGYFDTEDDNLKMLQSIHQMLHENGILVIDFMNAAKELTNLVPFEVKEIDFIAFQITKKADNQHIYKYIEFEDKGKHHRYMERVQALQLEDFKKLFDQAGFDLLHTFGNFDLEKFDAPTSNRLILIVQKR